jgi:hypothetical protein
VAVGRAVGRLQAEAGRGGARRGTGAKQQSCDVGRQSMRASGLPVRRLVRRCSSALERGTGRLLEQIKTHTSNNNNPLAIKT